MKGPLENIASLVRPPPAWLMESVDMRTVPVCQLLDRSAYYPACAYDGRVVQYSSAYCHSFVYVDARLPPNEVEVAISQSGAFRGYRLFGLRSLDVSELEGTCPWSRIEVDPNTDGDPKRYAKYYVEPFAHWAIFERDDAFPESHGPRRFSLLYVGGDGVEMFQRLYYSNGVAPSVVAIIQPGDAFGYNWTRYADPKQIFGRAVLGNSHCFPEYLFYGGRVCSDPDYPWARGAYKQTCWPSHGQLIRFWGGRWVGWRLGLWQRKTTEEANAKDKLEHDQ